MANGGGNLSKVSHIVVLMMENRSFDHMLGYLKGDGLPQLEGLEPEMGNVDSAGVERRVEPIGDRLLNEKVFDPAHGKEDVDEQLRGRNSGFLQNYEKTLARNREHHRIPPNRKLDETLILSYQTATNVPVYDYLARRFQVLDHWFSSVPGPTWANRQFAVTGGEGPPALPDTVKKLPGPLRHAPIYDRPAFTRWLDDDAWRWYSFDPGTLRLIDSKYRLGGAKGWKWDKNFAYFSKKTLMEWSTFIDDALAGKLPAVSWIDPNFVDFRLYGPPGSNDDHPPSNVMAGQELVLNIIMALLASPEWNETMLLITYDEHGGFYDHVVPSDFEVPGDPGASYGVRVPAMVISPLVDPGVNHTVFDHTSIPKTILSYFSDKADEAFAVMGSRTSEANDLGALLTRDEPREPDPDDQGEWERLGGQIADWKRRSYKAGILEEPKPGEKLDEALTELQRQIVSGAMAIREGVDGLLPGKP